MTNNHLNTIYTTILQGSVGNIINLLNGFADDPLFADKFALVFGTTVSSEQFLQAVTTLPEVEIRSDADLAGALGAFSGQTQKVYLSESLVKGDPSQLEAVLLEEFGHYFDFRFNTTDTPGDEGELFSDVVRGVHLSDSELKRIQNEDEHAVISIGGQLISVEEAFGATGFIQFGTSLSDISQGIITDNSDNLYLTGFTTGTFPNNNNFGGSSDAFVAKYNKTGTQFWVQQFGSFKADTTWAISTDGNNIYVTGQTEGSLLGNSNLGSEDAFVVKYDASGAQIWVKQFGSSELDSAYEISVDSTGNSYLVGATEGVLPNNNKLGNTDAFIAKYDAGGTQIWIKQFGSSESDQAKAITIDNNNIYVTGYTYGSLSNNGNLGNEDAFIAKYNVNGTQLWTKQFGTSSTDFAGKINIDYSGNIYVMGTTEGSLPGISNLGQADAFIAKYDANGTQTWIKQFGSSAGELVAGIITDSSGNVYVSGTTEGSLYNNSNLGITDGFLAKYNASGTQLWVKQFGSSSIDGVSGISLDSSNNIYITGLTTGSLTGNTNSGDFDSFIVGFDANGNLLKSTPDTSLSNKLTTPIIRFQNTDKPGTYLFAGEQEAASIRQNYKGFKEEGLAFQVAVNKDDPLMQPFYRFQNTTKGREGTYLFADEKEAISIRQNYKNFKEEGLAFYSYSTGVGGGTTDFTRFQNKNAPGTYLFTGPSETGSVLTNFPGFTLEGSAFAAG